MTTPADAAVVAGAGAFLAASFGGVTTEHFILGTVCYMVGSAGRCALKISVAAEGTQDISWRRPFAAFAVSPFLGAFASMVIYLAASICHFEGDAAIGILLALSALRGSEGIQYIVSLVSKFAPSKLGGAPTPEAKL